MPKHPFINWADLPLRAEPGEMITNLEASSTTLIAMGSVFGLLLVSLVAFGEYVDERRLPAKTLTAAAALLSLILAVFLWLD